MAERLEPGMGERLETEMGQGPEAHLARTFHYFRCENLNIKIRSAHGGQCVVVCGKICGNKEKAKMAVIER